MTAMMKAAVVEAPHKLVVRRVPMPVRENEYQAKCEILFGATCTGTDLHIIGNSLPWKQSYPTILGHESIGRVIEVGAKVRHYKKGDLVFSTAADKVSGMEPGWGGFAEYAFVTDAAAMKSAGLESAGVNNRVLPPDLNPAAATMLLTWCEGYAFVKSMGVGRGAKCLILGSGGNGFAFSASAKALGAKLIVMSGNLLRLATAKAVGVTAMFNYRSERLMDELKQVCPQGYDFAVDVFGAKGVLNDVLKLIRRGATVSVYGLDAGFDCILNPWFKPSFHWYDGQKDVAGAMDEVLALMQTGQFDAGHWMDYQHPYALDDIARAYEDLRLRRIPHSKAVIRIRG